MFGLPSVGLNLDASVQLLNGWFSGRTVGLINHLEITGPLIEVAGRILGA
jgi:hypothetical protein